MAAAVSAALCLLKSRAATSGTPLFSTLAWRQRSVPKASEERRGGGFRPYAGALGLTVMNSGAGGGASASGFHACSNSIFLLLLLKPFDRWWRDVPEERKGWGEALLGG